MLVTVGVPVNTVRETDKFEGVVKFFPLCDSVRVVRVAVDKVGHLCVDSLHRNLFHADSVLPLLSSCFCEDSAVRGVQRVRCFRLCWFFLLNVYGQCGGFPLLCGCFFRSSACRRELALLVAYPFRLVKVSFRTHRVSSRGLSFCLPRQGTEGRFYPTAVLAGNFCTISDVSRFNITRGEPYRVIGHFFGDDKHSSVQ